MAVPKGHMQRNALGRIVGSRGLTAQQECYVITYQKNGGDAVAAAREAGYVAPQTSAYQLMRTAHVRAAITAAMSGDLEACLTMSTALLRIKLRGALDGTGEDIDADTLRKIVSALAARVLPSPKPLDEQHNSSDDVSIDDLETALIELKRQRSDAARVLEGDAQVIEEQRE